MERIVGKFNLPHPGHFNQLWLSLESRVCHVAMQGVNTYAAPFIWIETDADNLRYSIEVWVLATGAHIPHGLKHVGTYFQDAEGTEVWHVYVRDNDGVLA